MSTAQVTVQALLNEYRSQLERLSQSIAHSGQSVSPYSKVDFEAMAAMPLDQISQTILALKDLNSLYLNAIEINRDNYSDRQMAWSALGSLGMRPLSDAFSLITDQDAIEVYNAEHQQVFRSFNIFRCLSYTLDEMSRNAWWQLFERDDSVTARMFEVANEVLSQKSPSTILRPFGTHWVKEKFSVRQNRALLESRLVTPLLSTSGSRQIVGYMNVFRIVKLESLADAAAADDDGDNNSGSATN